MKKFLPGIAAVMLALAASAFTAHKTDSQWVFTGASTGDMRSASNYSQSDPQPVNCGSIGSLPCTVNLPEEVNSPEALQDYIDTHSNTQILANSPQKRN